MTKLIGLLSSTIQAILQAQIIVRYLEQQQIEVLKAHRSYNKKVTLTKDSRQELQWWIGSSENCDERSLIHYQGHVPIRTYASELGWSAVYQGI